MTIRLIFIFLSLTAIFYNLLNLSIPIFYKFYPWFTNYDYYYLFEAAKNYIVNGIPQIKYWPNSSAGLDLFAWDKFSQVLSYALILKIIGLDVNNIFLIDSIFKIISFLIIFFSMTMLSIKKTWIVLVLGLLCFDPVAYFFFINKQYYGLAYGFLFMCYIYLLYSFSEPRSDKFILIINGILSSVLFFWFIPMGILFYFSVSLVIVKAFFKSRISRKCLSEKIFFYFIGGLIGLILLYLTNNILSDNTKLKENLFSALSIYINDAESISSWKQRISFVLNTIFPPRGFSLIPPTILFLFVMRFNSFFKNNILNVDKENLIIIDGIIFVSIAYLIVGQIFPSNMYLERMSWSFPLLFYLIVKLFLDKDFVNIKKTYLLFLLFYFFLYLFFLFFKHLLNYKSAWLFSVFYGSFLFIIFAKKKSFIFKLNQNQKVLKFLSFVAIAFAIIRWEQFYSYKKRYHSTDIVEINNYFVNKSYNGYVVSNVPIGAFNHNIKVHLIQSYKGLINGVKLHPASSFIYLTKNNENFSCKNTLFKYGLHLYEAIKVERIGDNISACIGKYVPKRIIENQKIIYLDNLSSEIILDYLRDKQKPHF